MKKQIEAYKNKKKLINCIKTKFNVWNRYQLIVGIKLDFKIDLRSADLTFANLRSANLTSADLRSADLTSADLTFANLTSADLRSADLTSADLTSANLTFADLTSADLTFANLTSADLDFSSWGLSCKTLNIKKTSLKLRIQLCFHWVKLIENEYNNEETDLTEEEKELYKNVINYANKFHRKDVNKLINR
jgi:hypothetical protein